MNNQSPALSQLFAEYFTAGSEAYYATLYIPKEIQHDIQLLQFTEHYFWQLLFSSQEKSIRQQKINWWQQELKNTFLASNPCHPLSQALLHAFGKDECLPYFQAYLRQLMQLSERQTLSTAQIVPLVSWQMDILAQKYNIVLEGKVKQPLCFTLFYYRHLRNLEKEYVYHYRLSPSLPKYLNHEHFYGKNQQVIRQYINDIQQQIADHIEQLEFGNLPVWWHYPVALIKASLKKIKKQPQKIYNRQQIISPIRQLLICYKIYYANRKNNFTR